MKIEIGVSGRIISGIELGRYVKVIDDAESSGGYLIITSADADFKEDGFDAWVEDEGQLIRYFEEAGWKVNWIIK
ncbi:hypothetical protein [Paracidovorax konjaci]|uniref:hypothetical protein n=1 Tax=Paracidovorax konjaci TaxID=32040 RepID=UPI000B89ED32|nr:hypothetical protein [Paracidovorax konjaci]